ncbi:Hsp20/alpha crystallin family protein [Natrinema versiforme]|uniref:Hsp20/alpha crystallin family protein n=1 Tax=Natrinema versiforme TaxID=88724 RepID=A0A4P8WGV7_9EURY|nr:Hsp20/alpha crystallin family protein [Natrinema versiforme]QCS42364.1 Hsp20/alpha crystallin family protein [Natrinema versiforme]
MSDSNPDDDRDESADDRAYENDHWLSSLLSALESLENGPASTSGRRRGDRTIFDYDISIRSADDLSGDSPLDRARFGDDRSGDRNRNQAGDGDSNRSRKRRVRSSGPSSDHHVATRTHDDELLVTADVAGADPDDVTVGFDDSTLVVAVEGNELDRVDVPWRETTAEAVLKNGVLTVHIRPERSETEHSDETGDDG